jgi:hypothetical protein
MIRKLHGTMSIWVNKLDRSPGRKIWHNYRETILDIEGSYLARLNYVHQNPVHHGLVPVANQYPWCSAAWFESTASPAQVRTIYEVKMDRVNVPDDFEVLMPPHRAQQAALPQSGGKPPHSRSALAVPEIAPPKGSAPSTSSIVHHQS